jgi:hypothetical protein
MTIDVAKRVLEGFDEAIAKRATEAYPDLGSARAYTKFVTETPEGKEMFKASLRSRRSVDQAAQDFPVPKAFGPAGEELNRLAAFMARDKSLSLTESYVRLLADPARRQLVSEVKREELSATRAVADSRWPLEQAERSSRTAEWVSGLDAVGRRRFRPATQ